MDKIIAWLNNKKTFIAAGLTQLLGFLVMFGVIDAVPEEVSTESINKFADNLAGALVFLRGLTDMFQRIATRKAQKAAEDAQKAANAAKLEASVVSNAIVGPPRGFTLYPLMVVQMIIGILFVVFFLCGCASVGTFDSPPQSSYSTHPRPVTAVPVRKATVTVSAPKVSTPPPGYVCEGGYCYRRY